MSWILLHFVGFYRTLIEFTQESIKFNCWIDHPGVVKEWIIAKISLYIFSPTRTLSHLFFRYCRFACNDAITFFPVWTECIALSSKSLNSDIQVVQRGKVSLITFPSLFLSANGLVKLWFLIKNTSFFLYFCHNRITIYQVHFLLNIFNF